MEFVETAETVGGIWFIVFVNMVKVWEELTVENVEIRRSS